LIFIALNPCGRSREKVSQATFDLKNLLEGEAMLYRYEGMERKE